MSRVVERVLVLHGRPEPGASDLSKIIETVERDMTVDLKGVVVTTFDGGDGVPSEGVAKFLVLRLEEEGTLSRGALERSRISTTMVRGAVYVLAVVLAWGYETDA